MNFNTYHSHTQQPRRGPSSRPASTSPEAYPKSYPTVKKIY